ncbi:hypothetical protein HDU99_007006, partial [Rhizoclosmatium hyalinum]
MAALFAFVGDMPEDEGWETPRPWSEVQKAIKELELPEGHFFLVRYLRASVFDKDGKNEEAAWPVEWDGAPKDAKDGILTLAVATVEGVDAIKLGWKEEARVLGQPF